MSERAWMKHCTPSGWGTEGMSNNDTFAIAAHLHVLLRRKTGRVTDTEWLATNAEYAKAIVQFTRANAMAEGHEELLKWANRLEEQLPRMQETVRKPLLDVAVEAASRYVGGLR